jgi:hypothetical protein
MGIAAWLIVFVDSPGCLLPGFIAFLSAVKILDEINSKGR